MLRLSLLTLTSLMAEQDFPKICVQVRFLGENLKNTSFPPSPLKTFYFTIQICMVLPYLFNTIKSMQDKYTGKFLLYNFIFI